MEIKASNKIQGEIVSIEKDKHAIVILVKIDGPILTISLKGRESVDELGIKTGNRVIIVFKTSSVTIAKDD